MPISYLPDSDVNEIVLALVGGVGLDHSKVSSMIADRLGKYEYETRTVRISHSVLPKLVPGPALVKDKFKRANQLMDMGNRARRKYKDDGIAALGAVAEIYSMREKVGADENVKISRTAYIITSLKRPEEVAHLREVYHGGFYLIGVYSSPAHRKELLTNSGTGMSSEKADILINRDQAETQSSGQRTRNTFQLADFFIEEDGDEQRLKGQLNKIIDLLFGDPYITPTFDEYAMFLAFAASLHSADLSRQVGAIIAKGTEVLSSGSNDCPKSGGGLYWPEFDKKTKRFLDKEGGRDYTLKFDTNLVQRKEIFDSIAAKFPDKRSKAKVLSALAKSPLNNLTEFGRMVHAEMEALMNCARNSISSQGATLYATTFPCHNCAKHIVAAGIKEVVYVEPYPKSKALQFYRDSISETEEDGKVLFRPFIGVGPRQFFNLFSMELGAGRKIERKDKTGHIFKINYKEAIPRMPLRWFSYLLKEKSISALIKPEVTQHERSKKVIRGKRTASKKGGHRTRGETH